MTTKERAAAIRAEYKKRGWNSSKVSVRTEYFSMGSSITVTIRAAEVNTGEATRIAEELGERIDRCPVSHEILGGGNIYVHVGHSEECREVLTRRYVDAVQDAMTRRDAEKAVGDRNGLELVRCLEPVLHDEACIGTAPNGWGYSLWVGTRRFRDFDTAEHGAMELALHDSDQQRKEA